MLEKIIMIGLFTLLIHAIETLSYAVRLSGVRTGKIAVSLSLFNIIAILSRTMYTFQAILTGSLVDKAKNAHQLGQLKDQFHIILGSSSVGTLLGILFIPTFVALFSRVIVHFEVAGSVPRLIKNVATIQSLSYVKKHIRFPNLEMLSRLRIGGIPKRLLLLNTVITAIYTTGILSALYASVLAPEFSSTAQTASGVINGFATVLLVLFVDPKVALLTEQIMQGNQDKKNIDKVVGILASSRLIGTLLAQLLLVPAAYLIKWFCALFV